MVWKTKQDTIITPNMNYKLERNFNKEVPSWQSLLENYNWSLVNKKLVKHICPGFFCIS